MAFPKSEVSPEHFQGISVSLRLVFLPENSRVETLCIRMASSIAKVIYLNVYYGGGFLPTAACEVPEPP